MQEDTDTRLPIASWLQEHASFAQAGVFFPDWGYGCLASDDEAEMSHWPPFLAAAIGYLLDNYPDLRTSTTGQQLLTFIFGISAHQNTDASWHSIKLNHGLLKAMADLDFSGDYDAAHTILDTGGDAILAKEYSLVQNGDGFSYLKTKWSVPVQDIVKIYGRMGVGISALKLRYCMTRGFAALSALRSVGSALAPRYQVLSPFMSTELEGHFLGSIEEASTTTVMCWTALEDWLVTGAPSSDASWQICEPMATIYRRGKAGPYALFDLANDTSSTRSGPAHEISKIGKEMVDLTIYEMQKTSSIEDERDGILTVISTHDQPLTKDKDPRTPKTVADFLTPSIPYSEFGTSLAFLSGSGGQILAIGSPKDTDSSLEPARGGTYIVSVDQVSNVATQSYPDEALQLPLQTIKPMRDISHTAKFQSVHDVLLEQDYESRTNDNQYFGKSVANITISGKICIAIMSSRKIEIYRTINGTTETSAYITILDRRRIQASEPPLGSQIYTFHLSGMNVLAIASPWAGRHASGSVYLFGEKTLRKGVIFLDSAEIVIRLPYEGLEYDRLGSAITYSAKHQLLLLGLAGRRQVIAYKLDRHLSRYAESFRLSDPSPQILHTGFGSSGLLVKNNLLYVGSATEDYAGRAQAGIVRVYHLSPLYKKNSKRRNAPWTVKAVQEISPDVPQAYSEFGRKIVASHYTNDGIYITSPNYQDRGAVFYAASPLSKKKRQARPALVPLLMSKVFGTQRKQKTALKSNVQLVPCIVGYETNGRFGTDVAVGDQGIVAVGAPRAQGLSADARRAGKTYLFHDLCI